MKQPEGVFELSLSRKIELYLGIHRETRLKLLKWTVQIDFFRQAVEFKPKKCSNYAHRPPLHKEISVFRQHDQTCFHFLKWWRLKTTGFGWKILSSSAMFTHSQKSRERKEKGRSRRGSTKYGGVGTECCFTQCGCFSDVLV